MSAIKNEVQIQSNASKLYAALSEQAGYRGWWNKVAEVEAQVGGKAELNFVKEGHPVAMHFRIDEMKPNEHVRWTCVDHTFPDWVGTTLDWRLKEAGGTTMVLFEHGGWKGDAPAASAEGWKHFIGSLKSYVETGAGAPW